MRFVQGRTLSAAARAFHDNRSAGRSDALELPGLLNAFVTVCNAVAYAHARGVIHRDLKGPNVILGDFGEVVVLDWGLAKLVGRPESTAPAPAVILGDGEADGGFTLQGEALGTPAYMAPEQSAGRLDLIDRRTDVYGLGAILYEILTGAAPFAGGSTDEVLRKVREEAPTPPRRLWPEVPPALEALCLRALAKRPEDRPAAAADLAHEVQGWQEFERRKAEEALRESEALYHSLVENLPCIVLRKDLEGRFTFANHRYGDLLNCPLAQILGRTDFDFFPRALAEKYRRDDRTVLESGGVLEVIEEVPSETGPRFCQVLKTAVRDAAGQVAGIQLIAWDVTARRLAEEERRKAEEALHESEELYHSLVESIPVSVWRKDLHGTYTFVNQRACEVMQRRREQILGKTDYDIYPVEGADIRRRADARVLQTSQTLETTQEFTGEDGTHYVRVIKTALHDAQGHVIGTQGIAWDVTEQKRLEEEVRRNREEV